MRPIAPNSQRMVIRLTRYVGRVDPLVFDIVYRSDLENIGPFSREGSFVWRYIIATLIIYFDLLPHSAI